MKGFPILAFQVELQVPLHCGFQSQKRQAAPPKPISEPTAVIRHMLDSSSTYKNVPAAHVKMCFI